MESPSDPDFMMSLAKGLAVLRCFGEQRQPMTIARASELTGLSRASVRRCLHTLVRLGYAATEGHAYTLQPSAMALGYAYLSSNSLAVTAQPLLERVTHILGESCSLGVLDGDDVWYVARSETSRIMSVALRVGSRLPLYCTSMGRVLLASRSREQQEAYLDRTPLAARTPHGVTERGALLSILEHVREQGFALVDQELEMGLRSVAVPVFDRAGQVLAAMNIGTQAIRATTEQLHDRYLPELHRAALALTRHGR